MDRNKRVVLGRYKNAGGICNSVCRSKSSTELMLSVSKRDVKQSFFIFIFIISIQSKYNLPDKVQSSKISYPS